MSHDRSANPTDATRCPACNAADLSVFFESDGVPVLCNRLWPDRDAARGADRGPVRLGFCSTCGMIYNVAFDPALIDYDADYENSLHFSAEFQRYAHALVADLIERHGLRDKRVVEIGCGKGEFLRMLCEAGAASCIGYDASYEGAEEELDGRLRFVRSHYTDAIDAHGDLICCRHVLEHIPEPVDFLTAVHRAGAGHPGASAFFEVPNVLYTVRDLGIWDIIYEHCSYFSAGSLSTLFRRAGYTPDRTWPTYGDQFLCLEAGLEGSSEASSEAATDPGLEALTQLVESFAAHHREKVDHWQGRLHELAAANRQVAIWGAGSKGVTFLNSVEGGSGVVCAVDINTRKHGRYVAGTGQEVVGPQRLASLGVDTVLVMNPRYEHEIRGQLADLGLKAEVEIV